MKHLSIILLAWMMNFQAGKDLYVCKNAKVTLFSSAPIEDIKAETSSAASVFNATTGELNFVINISSFKFPKSLMQEHFNSDYMESDKYPRATFRGKIAEKIDVTKDGSYPVTATGELTVHNVTQNRSIPGIITVKGGVISMKSEFMVKCADHHIDIPRIVFHNIAETIKITVAAMYTPNK
ncbi:YceI family protein [Mucilaginibacter sp. L3T2-6]|uniref:YceI family protein n=1 Tax=Mucilaginibacter sp. L3T2-6 TaxID=3062491 RepID=UPI002675621D|nr:YceI family protein [Mucilaginibacter sp. L3T2-6]MDO3643404.1 YceI family protein [Mucilaginibacter sp. L3T2-6]MDV6215663.1 YceI family protein [Mucilaginibacter sp. L3T2-6]